MVNKMKDLIVIGAGDLAKDVVWLIDRINQNNKKWNLLGFTEKNMTGEFMGYPVLGDDSVLENYEDEVKNVISVFMITFVASTD